MMDFLGLAKILSDGYKAAKSPEAREPMNPWVFLGVIAGTLAFVGIFGYFFINGRLH